MKWLIVGLILLGGCGSSRSTVYFAITCNDSTTIPSDCCVNFVNENGVGKCLYDPLTRLYGITLKDSDRGRLVVSRDGYVPATQTVFSSYSFPRALSITLYRPFK